MYYVYPPTNGAGYDADQYNSLQPLKCPRKQPQFALHPTCRSIGTPGDLEMYFEVVVFGSRELQYERSPDDGQVC